MEQAKQSGPISITYLKKKELIEVKKYVPKKFMKLVIKPVKKK
tara:strand:- start:2137 stop:2265 length:129 start_codon:yes stop_codon:yes gene_type:complete